MKYFNYLSSSIIKLYYGMLVRLSVENYALIEKLDMELSPSLNIITGETGAGKSILLGALGLILGNRADTAALKDNSLNCIIEGVFDVSGYGLEGFFAENDLDFDTETTIRRVITPAGKSRAYVNDLPVQLTTLRELSARLIDIHSQNQSGLIADEGFRTEVIDSIAGNKAVLGDYKELYSSFRAAERELAELRGEAEKNRRDEDYLRHQYEQIAAVRLRAGELAELEAEQKELANAEEILSTLAGAENFLEDDEAGILPRLRSIQNNLVHISGVYPQGGGLAERLHGVFVELKDITSEVSGEAGRVECNPGRLADVDDRLNAIYSLLQKHRLDTLEELMALEEELSGKLLVISNSDESIFALESKVAGIKREATGIAVEITASRKKAAAVLGAGIEKVLERLGMPAARFECHVSPQGELSPRGMDEISFFFSANRNVTPQPLEKVASGGEVSRVMLALKSLVAKSSKLPTIIFDEIDTGVSGRIADATGEIIAELSGNMQVVNITHLPQVASKGDTQFLVYKEESQGRPQTRIRKLSPEERIGEIAKMLSGSTVTDAAITQARQLLGYR